MQQNWAKFWSKREGQPVNKQPFYRNFKVMHNLIKKRYGIKDGLKSLEVGCGRAIMSNFLKAYNWDTYCVDKYYVPPPNIADHKFYQADAFDLPFPDDHFDLVFSYGLIEHFQYSNQMKLLRHMLDKTTPTGISIHYIVPRKFTNWMEDDNVYRDKCKWLRKRPIKWTYPIIGKEWRTNQYLGKGFWFEDFGISYG